MSEKSTAIVILESPEHATTPKKLSEKELEELKQQFKKFEYFKYSSKAHIWLKSLESFFTIAYLFYSVYRVPPFHMCGNITPAWCWDYQYPLKCLNILAFGCSFFSVVKLCAHARGFVHRTNKWLWIITEMMLDLFFMLMFSFSIEIAENSGNLWKEIMENKDCSSVWINIVITLATFVHSVDFILKCRDLLQAILRRRETFEKIKEMGAVSTDFPYTDDLFTICGAFRIIELVLILTGMMLGSMTYRISELESSPLSWSCAVVSFIALTTFSAVCNELMMLVYIQLHRIKRSKERIIICDVVCSVYTTFIHLILAVSVLFFSQSILMSVYSLLLFFFTFASCFFIKIPIMLAVQKAGTIRTVEVETKVKFCFGRHPYYFSTEKGRKPMAEKQRQLTKIGKIIILFQRFMNSQMHFVQKKMGIDNDYSNSMEIKK